MVTIDEPRRNEVALSATSRRLHALVRNASDGILMFDAQGAITYASPCAETLTGIPLAELLGTSGTQLVHPDDLAAALRLVEHAIANPGVSVQYEVRVRHRHGRWVWTESTVTSLLDDPDVGSIVTNFRDVSQRKTADAQREAVARLGMEALRGCEFGRLAGTAVEFLVEVLDANSAAILERADAGADELVVRACVGWPQDAVGKLVPAPVNSPAGQTLARGTPVVIDDYTTEAAYPTKPLVDAAGIRSSVGVVIAGHNGPWGIVGVLSAHANGFGSADVDFVQAVANVLAMAVEHERTHAALSDQALHDPLTGLANRALLVDRIESGLASGRRSRDAALVVQVLDLDNFKKVNDTLGHDAGDELLREVARRLQAATREEDTVARLGSDEFVIVTRRQGDPDRSFVIVDRVQNALRQPYQILGHELFVTASIGIAISSSRTNDANGLLRDANAAVHQAKTLGRDRYEIFDRSVRIELLKRSALERDLRHALTHDELRCYYQPVVNSTTGQVVGFEALARWAHPRRGLISPDEFIPVAEDTGLILPIGRWMIRTACEQLARWQRDLEQFDLGVSVNLSPRQLVDPELLGCLRDAIESCGIRANDLRLEITETVIVEDLARATGALQSIADIGVGLVLDDFGTGYSSLAHLKRLPVGCIKIDRAFVTDVCHNPIDRSIVAAVAALANELGICAVAEGVETREQLAAVRSLGCSLVQGYLYSRPLPASDLDTWLRERTPVSIGVSPPVAERSRSAKD